MKFGLPAESLDMIVSALSEHEEIEQAAIFGSRSMGNYKRGSDVDLALFGDAVTPAVVSRVRGKLNEELPLPYMFDVVQYNSISDDALRRHIDDYGTIFYSKKAAAGPETA